MDDVHLFYRLTLTVALCAMQDALHELELELVIDVKFLSEFKGLK